MQIGALPPGDPGVFRSLLLPTAANALAQGEPVTAIGLTEGSLALGAAAGYLRDGQFHLLSLYVAPHYRRCGGGTMLLNTLRTLLTGQASDIITRFTVTEDEHQSLCPFLTHMGFVQEDSHGRTIYLTTLGKITQLPFFSPHGKGRGTPLCQLGQEDLAALAHTAQALHAPLPAGGLDGPYVERNASVAYLEHGVPQAYVIGDTSWPGGLTLSAVWSNGVYPALLPSLLRIALVRAAAHYPPETPLAIQTISGAATSLLQALLPDAAPISFTMRLRLPAQQHASHYEQEGNAL